MGTSDSLISLSGTDMLILGLEYLRRKAAAAREQTERKTTYTEREIYDYDTKKIITLRTRTVTLTERN
ncbi:hypothetical protein [Treponema sp. C6A8]|uniref:hypothetical protein n=1 Tax=Treponema sp. C6A8 TaxID=1410609 RepID=UPI000481C635|nr:hypothetical protein [Treponema sp. C6A8]